MDYLLKTSAIITIFYTFYKLFLQRETFFQSNRWFLLIGILTAVFVPLIVIPVYVEQPTFFTQDFSTSISTNVAIQQETIDWMIALKFIYLGGILFFGGKFIFNLISLGKLIKSHPKEKNDDYSFIKTSKNTSPFSFFNFIVFNPNQFEKNELEQIITHEKVHVKQLHSIDVLISQVASIIFWFNPFIWMYKKSIQQNLEFIADNLTQQKYDSEINYQRLLLKSSLPQNQLALTNNFYNSLIKKRIIMLHKNRSKSKNQWKYTLILPLIALFMMSFNTEKVFISKSDTVFTVSPETTTQELKSIEKHFKNTSVQLKFSDIKRNSKGELNNVSINTKYQTDNGFVKRMTVNKENDKNKIKSFNLLQNGDKIVFSSINDKTNTFSIISNDNISFSEDFTIGKHQFNKETEIEEVVEQDTINDTKYNDFSFSVTITKDSNTKSLNKFTKMFNKDFLQKELGEISLKFNGIKRNEKNEIIAIKIFASSKTTKANYSTSSNKPIKSIKITVGDKGNDISISKAVEKLKIITENGNNKIKVNTGGNFIFITKDEDNKNNTTITTTIEEIIYEEDDNQNNNIIEEIIEEEVDSIRFNSTSGKNILYYIDGKKTAKKDLDKLSPNDIKSISVLKGKAATKKYGKKGKEGVILISTSPKKISTSTTVTIKDSSGKENSTFITDLDGDILYYINGEKSKKKDVDNLNPNDIKSMTVLKGDAAIKKYGKKVKDGVILIITKKKR